MLAAHRGELLAFPGVAGVGQGDWYGEPCILVFVERSVDELPAAIDGYPVRMIESGSISPLS